jgi:hypothetical protein
MPKEVVHSLVETGSPMSKKKQNEREKMLTLLRGRNDAPSSEKLQKLGVFAFIRMR